MKVDLKKINKILIIQYEPWGDVLINTALFPSIRKKFPKAEIHYLVRKPFHNVLNGNPFLDEVIVFENGKGLKYFTERIKLINKIRSKKYDLIIDQLRGTGSAQIVFFSRALYKLGFQHRHWNFVYNIKPLVKNARYTASMKFDLLIPLGIKEEPYRLYYYVSKESQDYIKQWMKTQKLVEEKIICFSPGSPVLRKKWNYKNYAKLGDLINTNTNYKVVLLWAPAEKEDVEKINKEMKTEPVIAPPTDFNQAAALLQQTTLLVCNDGGINHLAAAVSTPTLAIFGSTSPKKWCPVNLGEHYCLHNPNADSLNDNTFGISAEEAFEKIKFILSKLKG